MCGIGGICSSKMSQDSKRDLVYKMGLSMTHRGPDNMELFVDENIGIVNTRLSIVDRGYSNALMWNEKRDLVVTFNGEIYNYKNLYESLSTHHEFITNTDTEVLANLLSDYGPRGIDYLLGDFAFATWSTTHKNGILARDRAGVKPLYYAFFDGVFVFASEIRAILSCFPSLREIDELSLYDFLTYRYVPGPQTIFRDIKKLPPGSWLSFTLTEKPIIYKYWDYSRDDNTVSDGEGEIINKGRDWIKKIVLDRVPSEVNFGTLLSGGLDSSLITAILARNNDFPIRTFSVVYPEDKEGINSEHTQSRLIAEMYKTKHTELSVNAEMFRNACLDTILSLEEPIADPPAVLLNLICRVAKDDVTVMFSGEGADELMGGYYVYPEILNRHEENSYSGMGRLFDPAQKIKLLSKDFLNSIREKDGFKANRIQVGHDKSWDALHHMLYVDCKYWLVDDLLTKADKMGMKSSIEIRVPYLDHRFIDFAYSIPSNYKIRGNKRKYILSKIAESYLPDSILLQPKRGFSLPLGLWLKGELRPWLEEEVMPSLLRRDFLNRKTMKKFFRDYFSGAESRLNDHIIWAFVVLELHQQAFFEHSS